MTSHVKGITTLSFLRCFLYLALLGLCFFVIGRVLPKQWFKYDLFPYKSFSFEQGGALYDRLAIRRWKNQLPDMSQLLPGCMPVKKLSSNMKPAQLELLIQETCVAEWIHLMLSVFGFGCLSIWRGAGGVTVSVLYLLGNLPFGILQRYNRPKLIRLLERLRKKHHCVDHYEELEFELQYEARI